MNKNNNSLFKSNFLLSEYNRTEIIMLYKNIYFYFNIIIYDEYLTN